MNNVGEIINYDVITKSCRQMDIDQLMRLLKSDYKFWSWGASNFIVDNSKNVRMFKMNVNGHHHKGHVYIFLNGADLFDVYLTTKFGTIKIIGTDLYFDMLVDWIDKKIEKIPDYVR